MGGSHLKTNMHEVSNVVERDGPHVTESHAFTKVYKRI